MKNSLQDIRAKQDEFMKFLDKKNAKEIEISPDYQWAQSLHTLYIEIKFGPKFSAPASCLEFTQGKRSVSLEIDTLVVKASCYNDGIIRKFTLKLPLENRVVGPLYAIDSMKPGEDDKSLEHFTMGTGIKFNREKALKQRKEEQESLAYV